jgi:Beta-lactamase
MQRATFEQNDPPAERNMEFKFAHISESGVVPSMDMGEQMTALETTRGQPEEPSSREFLNSGNTFGRVLRHSCWTLLCLSAFILAGAPIARGVDDNENSTPTAWWIYTGQTFNDVSNTIKNLNARVVDIKVDNSGPNPFTVTYVQNTGSYAKQWWWYVGIDAATVAANLSTNNARLISLKAYDTGGGNIRFAVAMISNKGADAKAWWYYFGKSPGDISNLTKTNNARLTALQSYTSNGQTFYSCIMIANTGADNKGWWWYFNTSTQAIGSSITSNNARLLDLTSAGNGNFNAVMESCASSCPAWWWYYGLDANGVLSKAQNDGARVLTADTYQGCNGPSQCFATLMIGNTPADITACDSQGCISEAKFLSNICGTLANQVVGYSCLVGGLRPVFGGQARTNADPPSTAMAPDLPTDIASVSKTMTATGILQLLAKDGLSIDTKISPYIYPDWTQGPNISQLTFKELLTHSSGLGQLPQGACGNDITYSGVKSVVASGVTATNIGAPSYGNCNFALLRELMPALSGQTLTTFPDGSLRALQSSSLYMNYMNAHVFQPVSVPSSQCKPPTGTNDILSYPNPAGTKSGNDWGDWSLDCGSGGWMLSADEIFRVINDLATGNVLLTSAEKKQMFTNCLGWDCAVRSDCPSPNVCKNGDLNDGAGTAVWTYAGIFKCNVPVVVVVNSPLPSPYQNGGDIIGLVENAYKAAAVPGTPRACP